MGMYVQPRNHILPADRMIAIDISNGLNCLGIAQKYGAAIKTVQGRIKRMGVITLENGKLRLPPASSQPVQNPSRITSDGKAITLPFVSILSSMEKDT